MSKQRGKKTKREEEEVVSEEEEEESKPKSKSKSKSKSKPKKKPETVVAVVAAASPPSLEWEVLEPFPHNKAKWSGLVCQHTKAKEESKALAPVSSVHSALKSFLARVTRPVRFGLSGTTIITRELLPYLLKGTLSYVHNMVGIRTDSCENENGSVVSATSDTYSLLVQSASDALEQVLATIATAFGVSSIAVTALLPDLHVAFVPLELGVSSGDPVLLAYHGDQYVTLDKFKKVLMVCVFVAFSFATTVTD